jgi:hypothetical protein
VVGWLALVGKTPSLPQDVSSKANSRMANLKGDGCGIDIIIHDREF